VGKFEKNQNGKQAVSVLCCHNFDNFKNEGKRWCVGRFACVMYSSVSFDVIGKYFVNYPDGIQLCNKAARNV
jgi:hypothetical protein